MNKLLILFGTLLIFPFFGHSQNCCDTDAVLVICYTAMDDYCNPAVCDYTFDGDNMEGIQAKINNPANFGLMGISDCEVETKPLNNITSSADVENLDCDIVFIGAFYTNLQDITETTLPDDLLNSVFEWSQICEENLTILTQGESTAWGYQISNQNANPNTAGNVVDPNIFDGAFGTLNSFNQGGSFQANFSVIPSTGAVTLAEDALGRPTVVLDNATNDILLADVGIICSGGAGDVTETPNVDNSNDILACNIFALGCEIAGVATFTTIDTIICLNTDLTLPDGMVVDVAGSYTSNLLSSTDCDSTVVTNLSFSEPDDGLESYIGCDGDGYTIEIGGIIYDQNNPTGSSIIPNIYGCDSLVNVNLIYNEHTTAIFDTVICVNSSFQYLGGTFDGVIDTFVTILNAENCDSVVNVIVNLFEFSNIEVEDQVEVFNNDGYTFENIIAPSYAVMWEPSEGLSCSDCPNPSISIGENIPSYNVQLISPAGCESNYTVDVEYICTPYIPNIFSPNSNTGNALFGAETPCALTDYSMTIYDRWGSIVFSSADQTKQWGGRIDQRKDIVPGVYVYSCSFTNRGKPDSRTGTVTLLR